MMTRFRRTWPVVAAAFLLLGGVAFAQGEAPPQEQAFGEKLDAAIGKVNEAIASVLFWDVAFGLTETTVVNPQTGEEEVKGGIPFLLMVLLFGGFFFSFWYRWISIRGFRHSIEVIRGKYDRPEDTGEISHFRALTSALSATIGLGNIAGVAIAIQLGGPGAVFWMWLTAVVGMATKFSSCTLSQLFRKVNADGTISGGPMYYLDLGLRRKGPGWGAFGKVLGVSFAVMTAVGAMGLGNMFQSNQSFGAIASTFGIEEPGKVAWVYGLILSGLVALVVIGGIKRIGAATSKIVPIMCILYVATSLVIIAANAAKVPESLGLIFRMAFTDNAVFGGLAGVLVWGVKRAAFSNEAGLGSAAMAHAAAKTDEPVREGIVAMIGPFIDTIVVCTMTALVIIVTGSWLDPQAGTGTDAGVALTVKAFGGSIPGSQYFLVVCIVLFAYSSMISWCYYGERAWIYLLDHFRGAGLRTVVVFRLVFVVCVFVGSVVSLGAVVDFSDLMNLSMAFPNIVGSVILAPFVLGKVRDYWRRYRSGEMKTVR